MAPGGPPVVVLWILPRCVVKFQPATTQRIWEKNSPMVDCVRSMGQAQNSSKFHRPFGVVWGSTHLPRKMIKPGFLWCFFNKKWGSPAMGCTSTLLERQAWAPVLILFLLQICLAADAWAFFSESDDIDIHRYPIGNILLEVVFMDIF